MNRAVREMQGARNFRKNKTNKGRLPRAVIQTLEQLECRQLLSGSISITPTTPLVGDTNLTAEGNLDWLDIGYPANPTAVHTKNHVTGPRLSAVTTVGGSPVTVTTPGKTFTWTDATPPIGTDVTLPSDPVTLVNGQNDSDTEAGAPPAAETQIHSFDNLTDKYLNFLDLNSGVTVTPAANGGNGTVISGLRLYTANDSVERDPASYKLEGSNDGGATWSVISSGGLALPTGRNAPGHVPNPNVDFNQTVVFDNSTSYKSYRVTFPTLRNSASANSMQIGEIELLNKVPAENATATSDAAAISGNGNGFHFTVPSSPVLKRLKVYVAVDGGGTGTLKATLSDGSVVNQTSSITDTNAAGATVGVFTIDFKSTVDNATMAVDWLGSNNGTVVLSAVDWSAAGQLTVTPTTPISGDTNLNAEGNLDWEQIGYPSNSASINRKSGTPYLGIITPIGSGTVFATTTPDKTFTLPTLVDITSPNDPVTRVDGTDDDGQAGAPPAGEEEFHAFDNNTQKYLNFQDLNSGVIVTPLANNGNGTVINAMRLYTANDSPERDPASYTIEGSNDGGATWQSIAAGGLALPDGRNTPGQIIDPTAQFNQVVQFDNQVSYKSYRVRFPTTKDSGLGNSMQIGEIELLQPSSDAPITTSDAAASIGDGTGFHLTAPASPVLRRLKVYVGIENGGTGTLTATLSDGSVLPATLVLNDTNASGPTLAVYTIDYKTGSDSQTLSVDWVASNGGMAIVSAATFIELTPPSAPIGVTVVPTGQGKLNVSWLDTAANETGFLIERAPDQGGSPGTFVAIGATKANVTQFLDSSLPSSTKYYYRISAINPVATVAAATPGSGTTHAFATTGLKAQYWNDPNNGATPTGHNGSGGDPVVFTQTVPNIAVDWLTGSPDPSVGPEYFSSQWDGTYTADYTGPTTFYVNTDDGGRFFIDLNGNGTFDYDPAIAGTNVAQGELVVNTWMDHGQAFFGGSTVNLVAGQQYKIRMQQFEHTGGAAAFLYVQTAFTGANPVIIPTENLSSADSVPPTIIGDPEVDRPLPVTATYTPKQHIVVHFSEPIILNSAATISLFGSDGFVYNASATVDNGSNSLILTFPDLPLQELPTANYRLYLPAFAITDTSGNQLDGNADGSGGDDYLTTPGKSFYSLKGDTQAGANGVLNADRRVTFIDYQRIETNFGKTSASASDGDVNHDGKVDRADLQIIAGTMGNALFVPLPGSPVPSAPAPITKPAPVSKPVSAPAVTPIKTAPVTAVKSAPVSVLKPVAKVAIVPPPKPASFSSTRVSSLRDWLSA